MVNHEIKTEFLREITENTLPPAAECPWKAWRYLHHPGGFKPRLLIVVSLWPHLERQLVSESVCMTSKPVPKTFGLKKVLQAPPCCQRHLVARLEKNRVFARKNNSGLFKRKPKNMFKTLVVLSKITTNKNLGAKGFGKLLSSCQIIHSDLLYYTTPPFHIVVGENWSVAVNYSHIVIGATMVISNLVKHQLSQTVWGWSLSKSLNRFMPRQTTNSAEWQLKRPSLHCSVFFCCKPYSV